MTLFGLDEDAVGYGMSDEATQIERGNVKAVELGHLGC